MKKDGCRLASAPTDTITMIMVLTSRGSAPLAASRTAVTSSEARETRSAVPAPSTRCWSSPSPTAIISSRRRVTMVVKKDGVSAWAAPLQIPEPTTAAPITKAGVSSADGDWRVRAASMIHPVAIGTARSRMAPSATTTMAATKYLRTPVEVRWTSRRTCAGVASGNQCRVLMTTSPGSRRDPTVPGAGHERPGDRRRRTAPPRPCGPAGRERSW